MERGGALFGVLMHNSECARNSSYKMFFEIDGRFSGDGSGDGMACLVTPKLKIYFIRNPNHNVDNCNLRIVVIYLPHGQRNPRFDFLITHQSNRVAPRSHVIVYAAYICRD